jgi:hypothetical protein
MPELLRVLKQVPFYLVFALPLAYFSRQPAYQHRDPGQAQIKLSLSHAGQHKEDCRRLTPEELARLAPNMRKPISCNRERVPLYIEILMDGELLYRASLPPAGLARDGESTAYERFAVRSGSHIITARLRDSRRTEGFDYERSGQVDLSPQQNFVLSFNVDTGGFLFL